MKSDRAVSVQTKIIRRISECNHTVGEGEFHPKTLEAIELHYAQNRALRVTRQELSQILAALQSDLEYREGVIRLVDPP